MKTFYTVILILSVSACGGGTNRSAPSNQSTAKEPLTGSLTKNVEEISRGKYRDSCESKYLKMQQEIAAALDARAAEIEEFAPTLYESKTWKVVQLGKTFVRERKTEPKPKAGWQTDDEENWGKIYEEFLKMKDEPMNQNWVWLNGQARGIIVDDRDRAVRHANYAIGKEDGTVLRQIAQSIAKCLAVTDCDSLKFSEAESRFIQGNSFYSERFKIAAAARSLKSKRDAIGEMDAQVQSDLMNYSFKSNRSVVRTSAKEIILPLDAADFGDVQTQVAGYIESIWQNSDLAVKVKWVQHGLDGVFRLFFDEGTGGRSFVQYSDQSVHLLPYVRSRSIAHEIGHVLGFGDHYFTKWSAEKCGYLVEFSEADIMSEPSSGGVTDEEWKELNEAYPLN